MLLNKSTFKSVLNIPYSTEEIHYKEMIMKNVNGINVLENATVIVNDIWLSDFHENIPESNLLREKNEFSIQQHIF